MKTNPVQLLLKIPVPWVFILVYLFGVLIQLIFPIVIHSMKLVSVIKISGIVFFAIGVFFACWSLFIFHKGHTTTTPGEESNILVTKGPYLFTRNPMYISLTLAYLGEAGLLTQLWPVLVLPLMFVYLNRVVIPLEENLLKKVFDGQYETYCKRVRRWL
jgi:protein-S-isoprenylcysteine O-methyltransferase Ste14